MEVFSIAKGFYKLSKDSPPELSRKELDRLRAITLWKETKDVKLVCETFGISRATFYRWLGQFDPKDLSSLKERSRSPVRRRRPEWSSEVQRAVKELRTQYPRWGGRISWWRFLIAKGTRPRHRPWVGSWGI